MAKRLIIVVVICFLCGCRQQEPIASDAKSLRIISLSPAATEILFRLDLEDQIVGVTTYCNYPPETKQIEKVGTFSHPNIEKLISLKPDIIFATGLEQSMIVEKLKNLHLNIFVSYPSNIDEIFKSIAEIGRLTNRNKEAGILLEEMKAKIELIKNKVKAVPLNRRPKVFVQIYSHPLITVGKKSFINELITLAGGINITSDIDRPYSRINLEVIVKRNPDCIILAYMSTDDSIKDLENLIGYRKINAIKNNRVFGDIDPNLILRTGPRITEGLEELFKRIHNLN